MSGDRGVTDRRAPARLGVEEVIECPCTGGAFIAVTY
jgi:hypothetical protein